LFPRSESRSSRERRARAPEAQTRSRFPPVRRNALSIPLLFLVIGVSTFVHLRSRAEPQTVAPESHAGGAPRPTILLRGATQFDESHAFTRALRKFEEIVEEYCPGRVRFELYLNSELGLEKDYFAYMSQGIAVDYAVVSPSHMSTFSSSAPLMDMPFLFRDLDHWNRVCDSDALRPIAEEIERAADVLLIGYAGGGVRNLIVEKPVTNLDELAGLSLRVMGAPIQTRIFRAIGAAPTVIAYSEVYN